MLNRAERVVKYTGFYEYKGRHIPYAVWAHLRAAEPPDTVLFLGAGQAKKITKWVAQQAPAGIAIVEGLPNWQADPNGNDLLTYTAGYLSSAYDFVLHAFSQTKLHIMAESQSTPAAIQLGVTRPTQVRNALFMLPMGLTTGSLGGTDAARFKEFKRRTLHSLRQPRHLPVADIRNVYISFLLGKILIGGLRSGSFKTHYTIGVSYDATAEFKALWRSQKAKHASLTLFLGGQDKLFPAQEIQQSLSKLGLSDVPTRVFATAAHSSLALRKSKQILAEAVMTVRQTL